MKAISILILGTLLQSCAFPQYASRLIPINEKATVSKEQAIIICRSQASIARTNAVNAAQARVNQRNSQVTSYDCSTQGSSYYGYNQSHTNCTPQTVGQNRGLFAPLADATDVTNAGENAAINMLQSCLAREGWKFEQYCVKNCQPM